MDPEQQAALSRWRNVGQLFGAAAIVTPRVVARVIAGVGPLQRYLDEPEVEKFKSTCSLPRTPRPAGDRILGLH